MIKNTPIATFVGETNPYEEVDYLAEARERTTSQFKDRDVFNRYLELLLSGRVELQEVIKDLIQNRSFDSAEGEQLNVIGRILGQPRELFDSVIIRYFGFRGASGASPYKSVNDTERTFGPWKGSRDSLLGVRALTDAEYRRLLKLQIIKNTSDANITAFNDGVRLLFGVDRVDYQEETPPNYIEGAATITISIGRDYNDPEKAAFPGLDEIELASRFLNRPLGVGVLFQDPVTFFANFKTITYEQFVFGQNTNTLVSFEEMFDLVRPYEDDYYDSSGVLQTAAVNQPRYGYDQNTLEPYGILIEGPDEILTHTWGLEVNDTQGTIRIGLNHFNTSGKEAALILEGEDVNIVLFRENTFWKLRVEWANETEDYEMIISQYPTDQIAATISYTPNEVYLAIEDENRYVPIVVPYGGTNLRGFDMRMGGSFTTNVGDTYGHFNGAIENITYLRAYVGENELAVVDGMYITTEDYIKILTELDATLVT